MFLVDPKVFRFVVKGVKAIFLGVQRGWGLWSLPNRPLTLSTHISNSDDIGQCWIFTSHFYAVFWQPFWKFWKCRIAPLMVTYHFRAPWTCPRQISGTTRQNFMKLGGVIDICF
jgi:hypothetical protein